MSQHGSDSRALIAIMSQQCLSYRSAQGNSSRRAKPRIEHVLIEDVDKAVMQSQGMIGEVFLTDQFDECVDALQTLEPFFHLRRVHLQGFSHHCGIEFSALDTGGN